MGNKISRGAEPLAKNAAKTVYEELNAVPLPPKRKLEIPVVQFKPKHGDKQVEEIYTSKEDHDFMKKLNEMSEEESNKALEEMNQKYKKLHENEQKDYLQREYHQSQSAKLASSSMEKLEKRTYSNTTTTSASTTSNESLQNEAREEEEEDVSSEQFLRNLAKLGSQFQTQFVKSEETVLSESTNEDSAKQELFIANEKLKIEKLQAMKQGKLLPNSFTVELISQFMDHLRNAQLQQKYFVKEIATEVSVDAKETKEQFMQRELHTLVDEFCSKYQIDKKELLLILKYTNTVHIAEKGLLEPVGLWNVPIFSTEWFSRKNTKEQKI